MRHTWRSLLPLRLHLSPIFRSSNHHSFPISRPCSSEVAEVVKEDHVATLSDLFSGCLSGEISDHDPAAIRSKIAALGLTTPVSALSILQSLKSNPCAARRFFNWASSEPESFTGLSSKCHNLMLEIIASPDSNFPPEECLELSQIMKTKGFGISKPTLEYVTKSLRDRGFSSKAECLEQFYSAKMTADKQIQATNEVVSLMLTLPGSFQEEVEKKLNELGVEYLHPRSVDDIIKRLVDRPATALAFYRWADESPLFSFNRVSALNVLSAVLSEDDLTKELDNLITKMRNGKKAMDRNRYHKIMDTLLNRKMHGSVVNLYVFGRDGGVVKHQSKDLFFLLQKIVSMNDTLDFNLITRLVKAYTSSSGSAESSDLAAVWKVMMKVNKVGEWKKVLKAMDEGGLLPDSAAHGKIISGLCDARNLEGALQYAMEVEDSGYILDSEVWATLVKRLLLGDELSKALSCFRRILERSGEDSVAHVFEALVYGLCRKHKPKEAYKVLKEIKQKNLKPSHDSYKYLIKSLVRQENIEEGLNLLGLMKKDGFPPFINPFISYIVKAGTVDDACLLLKAMTTKEFPSRNVYLQLFKAFFKKQRHEDAQELLSRSPGSVRNHTDVVELFFLNKTDKSGDGC